MATATAAKPGVTPALHKKYEGIFGPEGFLNKNNIERKEEIELLGLSVLAGVDALFLGEPGVGKTWMIELLIKHGLSEGKLFSHLLAKDQSADEVLGPRDVMAMKEGRIARMTPGYLPEVNIGYLDEVFKASPPMLNPLLDLLANRVLKMGGTEMDCSQLIAVVMSSNELPEREDLQAFRDRIGITKVVGAVRTPEGRRAVTDLQLDFQANGIDTTEVEPIDLAEIEQMRAECKAVVVPDAIRDMMGEAQQKWFEAGHAPSVRRVGQMWKVVRAHAWAAGRDTASSDDLIPCQHMAFNLLEHADSARSVILEFASKFTRKGERLKQALEPILAEMKALEDQVNEAQTKDEKDQLMASGFTFLRKLRTVKKEAEAQIKEGHAQGQDVTSLEEVLKTVTSAATDAQKKLMGDEEE